MKDYRLYIFDFDGTIFDSKESLRPIYKAGFDAIGDYTYKMEDADIYLHCSLSQAAEKAHMDPAKYPTFVRAIGEAFDKPENLALIQIFPETKECAETLKKRGKKICIATGNSEKHVELVLGLYHLDGVFSSIAGFTKVKNPKPYPDVLFEAAKSCGEHLDAGAVYIGDSLQDMECAKNAGIDGILIDRNNEHSDYPGMRISDLRQLLNS